MLPLIRTLFDIVLLRRGPDAIPVSWLLFLMTVGLWLFSALAGLALIGDYDENFFFLGLLTGLAGLACYSTVVIAARRPSRLLQTLSALIGCGALIFLAFLAEYILLSPFVGERVTWAIANLILLWSVPVEGHIIARAIDRHWYIGIIIAMAIFILQHLFSDFVAADTRVS